MRPLSRNHLFFIIAFFLIAALPTTDNILDISPVKELFEKRPPVARPRVPTSIDEVLGYPKKFEQFYNDSYGFR